MDPLQSRFLSSPLLHYLFLSLICLCFLASLASAANDAYTEMTEELLVLIEEAGVEDGVSSEIVALVRDDIRKALYGEAGDKTPDSFLLLLTRAAENQLAILTTYRFSGSNPEDILSSGMLMRIISGEGIEDLTGWYSDRYQTNPFGNDEKTILSDIAAIYNMLNQPVPFISFLE
ncbi:MAG: hypothetical protein JXA44_10235 [Methanospirillaceae archaeon]|nr:hypothetical protein [Methanospirillaceae archaeon]